MGIGSLLKYVKTKKVTISKICFERVFIDISCWIHKAKYADECDLAVNIDSNGFLNVINQMLSNFDNEKIIVCFDGETPEIKKDTHQKRRKDNDLLEKRSRIIIQTSKNKSMVYKAKRDLISTLQINTLYPKIKDFLNEKSIKWVHSTNETDEYIASHATEFDLVISEDSDYIPLGCENVLFKYDYKNNLGNLYNRITSSIVLCDEIRNVNDFKHLIEFCVLAGCDYFKYPKIGIKSAWKITSSYNKLKDFINNLDDDNREKFRRAVEQFKRPRIEPNTCNNQIRSDKGSEDRCNYSTKTLFSGEIEESQISKIEIKKGEFNEDNQCFDCDFDYITPGNII